MVRRQLVRHGPRLTDGPYLKGKSLVLLIMLDAAKKKYYAARKMMHSDSWEREKFSQHLIHIIIIDQGMLIVLDLNSPLLCSFPL